MSVPIEISLDQLIDQALEITEDKCATTNNYNINQITALASTMVGRKTKISGQGTIGDIVDTILCHLDALKVDLAHKETATTVGGTYRVDFMGMELPGFTVKQWLEDFSLPCQSQHTGKGTLTISVMRYIPSVKSCHSCDILLHPIGDGCVKIRILRTTKESDGYVSNFEPIVWASSHYGYSAFQRNNGTLILTRFSGLPRYQTLTRGDVLAMQNDINIYHKTAEAAAYGIWDKLFWGQAAPKNLSLYNIIPHIKSYITDAVGQHHATVAEMPAEYWLLYCGLDETAFVLGTRENKFEFKGDIMRSFLEHEEAYEGALNRIANMENSLDRLMGLLSRGYAPTMEEANDLLVNNELIRSSTHELESTFADLIQTMEAYSTMK